MFQHRCDGVYQDRAGRRRPLCPLPRMLGLARDAHHMLRKSGIRTSHQIRKNEFYNLRRMNSQNMTCCGSRMSRRGPIFTPRQIISNFKHDIGGRCAGEGLRLPAELRQGPLTREAGDPERLNEQPATFNLLVHKAVALDRITQSRDNEMLDNGRAIDVFPDIKPNAASFCQAFDLFPQYIAAAGQQQRIPC